MVKIVNGLHVYITITGEALQASNGFSFEESSINNSLPEGAVLAKDGHEFKSKIDQHWNHEVIYVY